MSNRKSSRWLPLVLAGVALLAFAMAVSAPKSAESAPPPAFGPASSIIVKFDAGAPEQAIAALNAAQGTEEIDAIPALGLRVLRFPPGAAAETVAAAYAKNPLVEFAEPNVLVPPEVTPNDTYYASAWHLSKMEAAAAWDSAKATGVLTAVCDTGVEGAHPDLAPILRGDLGWNAADGTGNWSPIAGHGTLVAGALAAATNNGTGVAGVAWGAQVIPVRITNFTDGSAYVSDAAKCIQGSADRGARAINLSYRMAHSSAIDIAGAYARQKGAVTLVAAGNDGIDPAWPDWPNFLAISATTSTDVRATWSNFGTFVDVAAPGNSIYTTRVGATYGPASGTSLASPVAAGVVALIFGANPGLTAAQAEAILLQSADDIGAVGDDPEFGAGRVNARKAVLLAGGGSAPAPTPAPTSTPTTAPTATPTTASTSTPAPTATPTNTPAPTFTPTPAPAFTPTPTPGSQTITDTFTGKVGGKNNPANRSHGVTVRVDGPMTVSLSWGGKANLLYTVYNSAGQALLSGATSGRSAALTLPAGAYTIVVSAISGQASYTLTAAHY